MQSDILIVLLSFLCLCIGKKKQVCRLSVWTENLIFAEQNNVWRTMIEQFLDYLRYERNRSDLTVKSYASDLRDFELFFKGLDEQLDWADVDLDIVRQWMESMMDRGNKPSSVRRRLSSLRAFFRHALRRGWVATDPTRKVRPPKTDKPLPQFVKESEMNTLLDEKPVSDNFTDVRNYTVVALFYATGMRMAELIGLRDADVDLVGHTLKVTGKRNKQRIIPFGDETARQLQYYISTRDANDVPHDVALFVEPDGRPLSRYRVDAIVRHELSKVTTLKKRSPHVLRHTFATSMLNHDASLEAVRKLLGHASLATTEIYTHTTFEQLKQSYQKAHPRSKDGEADD